MGAIAGMIAFAINAKVFRTGMNGILKYVVTGAVSVLAFIAYLVVATILTAIING